jgi:hypothetical protein
VTSSVAVLRNGRVGVCAPALATGFRSSWKELPLARPVSTHLSQEGRYATAAQARRDCTRR